MMQLADGAFPNVDKVTQRTQRTKDTKVSIKAGNIKILKMMVPHANGSAKPES